MKLRWPLRPAPDTTDTPEDEGQTPTMPEPINPQLAAQQHLSAAQAELEGAEYQHASLKQALLDGGDVTPEDIDAAETRVRHAALALDAAKAAHQRAHEQAARDFWPVFLGDHLPSIDTNNAEGNLQAALDALAPKVQKALADLHAALDEATASTVSHNGAIIALCQYLQSGAYSDPEDRASAWYRPEAPEQASVAVNGIGGTCVDVAGAVDWWLAHQLPVPKIAAWLERVQIARANKGLVNDYFEQLHG